MSSRTRKSASPLEKCLGFLLRHGARRFMNLLRSHSHQSLQRPKPRRPSHSWLNQFGDHPAVPSNRHPLTLFHRGQQLSELILCLGNAYVHICDSSQTLAISQSPEVFPAGAAAAATASQKPNHESVPYPAPDSAQPLSELCHRQKEWCGYPRSKLHPPHRLVPSA